MAQYAINETTLSSIGDSIREAKGEDKELQLELFNKIVTEEDLKPDSDNKYLRIDLDKLRQLNVLDLYILDANDNDGFMYFNTLVLYEEGDKNPHTVGIHLINNEMPDIADSSEILWINKPEFVEAYFKSNQPLKVGDRIRIATTNHPVGDNPETTYYPNQFAEEIDKIGALTIPDSVLNKTGNVSNMFSSAIWNPVIDKLKDKFTFTNITKASNMFSGNEEIVNIPFEINFKESNNVVVSSIFQNCKKLETLPKLNNARPHDLSYLFYYCSNLKEIPEDYFDSWDFDYIHQPTFTNLPMGNTFYECGSLRRIPQKFIDNFYSYNTSTSSAPTYNAFRNCNALDEIVNFPPHKGTVSSGNMFYNFVNNCDRLKRFTFAKNPDGTPQTANFKQSTLDISSYVGYGGSNNITGLNSGITADTRVTDDATYQALKNNPDYWTTNIAYSRYNHDSAVETINSLPDTSAYGTNTIKFKKGAGSATDGGAIENLTSAEIAVATAKGWTVTLVD